MKGINLETLKLEKMYEENTHHVEIDIDFDRYLDTPIQEVIKEMKGIFAAKVAELTSVNDKTIFILNFNEQITVSDYYFYINLLIESLIDKNTKIRDWNIIPSRIEKNWFAPLMSSIMLFNSRNITPIKILNIIAKDTTETGFCLVDDINETEINREQIESAVI